MVSGASICKLASGEAVALLTVAKQCLYLINKVPDKNQKITLITYWTYLNFTILRESVKKEAKNSILEVWINIFGVSDMTASACG